MEGTGVLAALPLLISSWLTQHCLHGTRSNLHTSLTHASRGGSIGGFVLFYGAGPGRSPRAWLRGHCSRLTGTPSSAQASQRHAGVSAVEGSRRVSCWMHGLCFTLFKTVPLSPQLASYAGGTWCFPYLAAAFRSTLWFPLLLGLCLLFTAPTFNSVREKLQ